MLLVKKCFANISMLPDYRFCALLMTNLLVYSIRTCKLLTSATGLRSSMATYTNRYYDIMVFYFVLRERERGVQLHYRYPNFRPLIRILVPLPCIPVFMNFIFNYGLASLNSRYLKSS